MRNISFSETTSQFQDGTKDVTRRLGWTFLKAGDLLCAVKKVRGLKKGEKVLRLGTIRVVSVRREHLSAIKQGDVCREGFPTWTRKDFIRFFCQKFKVSPDTIITRIEFEKVDI